jgi:hypothetical protein
VRERVLSRVVLGYVLGVLVFIPFLAASLPEETPFRLTLRNATDVYGKFRVFYDIGNGPREARSIFV